MNYIQFSSVKLVVSGKVQGVGYRYFIARKASELELNGYAKNLFNGDVEIVAEGRKEYLHALVLQAKEGPRNSRVDSCKVEWLDFKKKYDNFEIY